MKLTAEQGREIAASIVLTPAEIASERLRHARARDLFEFDEPEALGAVMKYFDVVAAGATARDADRIPEVRKFYEKTQALQEVRSEVESLEAQVRAKQSALSSLRGEVATREKHLYHERLRLVEAKAHAAKWREHYFTMGVGDQNPEFNLYGALAHIRAGEDMEKFTREEVLPELERRLAASKAKLDAFGKDAAA